VEALFLPIWESLEFKYGLSIVFFNVNLLYICLGETDPDCPSTETNVFVIGHSADGPVERGVTDRQTDRQTPCISTTLS